MSRHRDIRAMDISDEYDGYDDVYGHSVEDEYGVSPSTVAQFTYGGRNYSSPHSSFAQSRKEDDIQEESEIESDEHTQQRWPKLNAQDEVRLRSCLDEMRNVLGESFPESALVRAVMEQKFDCEKAINSLLTGTTAETTLTADSAKGDSENMKVEKHNSEPVSSQAMLNPGNGRADAAYCSPVSSSGCTQGHLRTAPLSSAKPLTALSLAGGGTSCGSLQPPPGLAASVPPGAIVGSTGRSTGLAVGSPSSCLAGLGRCQAATMTTVPAMSSVSSVPTGRGLPMPTAGLPVGGFLSLGELAKLHATTAKYPAADASTSNAPTSALPMPFVSSSLAVTSGAATPSLAGLAALHKAALAANRFPQSIGVAVEQKLAATTSLAGLALDSAALATDRSAATAAATSQGAAGIGTARLVPPTRPIPSGTFASASIKLADLSKAHMTKVAGAASDAALAASLLPAAGSQPPANASQHNASVHSAAIKLDSLRLTAAINDRDDAMYSGSGLSATPFKPLDLSKALQTTKSGGRRGEPAEPGSSRSESIQKLPSWQSLPSAGVQPTTCMLSAMSEASEVYGTLKRGPVGVPPPLLLHVNRQRTAAAPKTCDESTLSLCKRKPSSFSNCLLLSNDCRRVATSAPCPNQRRADCGGPSRRLLPRPDAQSGTEGRCHSEAVTSGFSYSEQCRAVGLKIAAATAASSSSIVRPRPFDFSSPSPDDIVRDHQKGAFTRTGRRVGAASSPSLWSSPIQLEAAPVTFTLEDSSAKTETTAAAAAVTSAAAAVRAAAVVLPPSDSFARMAVSSSTDRPCGVGGPATAAVSSAGTPVAAPALPRDLNRVMALADDGRSGAMLTGCSSPALQRVAATDSSADLTGRSSPSLTKSGSRARLERVDAKKEYEKRRAAGKDLINLVVIGHVDAGKSTLMGHLLYKVGAVSQKQIHKYEQESRKIGKSSFMYAWVLDETEEERARGVTMDVAHSTFETPTKIVNVLDAPGHKDFIPNMITGAAQADSALLVVNATSGEFESGFESGGQTREHAMLAKSLGISQMIVAVNKMDTVNWSEERYNEIVKKLQIFLKQTAFREADVMYVPCSGLTGINLATLPTGLKEMSWYKGESLLKEIEKLRPPERQIDKPFRMCVHDIYRGIGGGFCLAGQVEAGDVQPNDRVLVMPAGESAVVKTVLIDEVPVSCALAGDSVTLTVAGVDANKIQIGNFICDVVKPSLIAMRIRARVVIFNIAVPITKGFPVVFHYQSLNEPATITRLLSQLNKATGEVTKSNPRLLVKNTSGDIEIEFQRPICVELYKDFKELGRFMLRSGGSTIAAGVISEASAQ